MDARLVKLISVFEENGWVLKGLVDVSKDWWFEDILQLVSKWHPTDTNLYLTLLTDPQFSNKKVIWCIGISATIPRNQGFTYIDQTTLNDINKTDLGIFVRRINKIVLH